MTRPQDNEDRVINTPRPFEDKREDIQSPDEAQSEHEDSQLSEHVQPEDTPEDIPTSTVEEQYEPRAEQRPATFAQGILTTNLEISLPPTPSSRAPNDHEWRFKKMTSPCEWIEDYRPGGYHPVHLGDIFKDGEYKILRKLGEGSYSTVWLARDLRNSKYVAIKILVGSSETTSELQILRHITQNAPTDGARYVTQLLDEFEHHGPNGVHRCLVFEPMGPSVNTMVEELPQFKPRKWGMKIRYPPQMAKNILKQSLQALKFLHEQGIAHGDFQPGNIFFALDDIDSKPEVELRQKEDVQAKSISAPVQRLDGKQDRWAPRYLCIAEPLVPSAPCDEGSKIKLGDMGGAFFFTDPPRKLVTPLGLRPPELILTGEVHRTIDIWSFGCLIFQLITGQPLICVPWYESESDQDDDHLLSLTACLGALPNKLYREWKNSSLYFTPEGKLFNCALGGVAEGAEPLMVEQMSMEELFDEAAPDLEEQEAYQVKTLIRWILQYDPAERPTPSEVLLHPWFSQDATKSGTFK
ncbi:putative Serine protein kinase [Seiridium cardinale]|uniref:non-specific serine/threonine protein kinase n=1 Tax=Seiridium cardinale TaxID=138064 RepID=A0ABR2X5Q5_9PEZI